MKFPWMYEGWGWQDYVTNVVLTGIGWEIGRFLTRTLVGG